MYSVYSAACSIRVRPRQIRAIIAHCLSSSCPLM
jgi:hypothetical protein